MPNGKCYVPYLDSNTRFQALMDAVSHQIERTSHSDWEIANNCYTSTEFVRRQRKFLTLVTSCQLPVTREDEMRKKYEIAYDDLYREYVENGKTIAQCAEIFGCSKGVILSRMAEYGIQARPRGGNTRSKKTGEGTNGTPLVVGSEPETLKECIEAVRPKTRHLERLMFLSAVKGVSIQELLEEALELLFEKYR